MSTAIVEKIKALCKSRNAIILAHNYTRGEIQDIADYVGDSLGLSRTAAEAQADVIVFCGVHFMAETAAVLCRDKTVLIPDEHAGCPMANMVTPRELKAFKAEHPDAMVVTYVNSTAEIKALSDICCTSANAVEVVKRIPEDREIIFVPDRNLGGYVQKVLGRKFMLWEGFCPTHERMLPEYVRMVMDKHPEALLVAHPECRSEVADMAHKVASTTGILKFCAESDAKEFIIGTESGLLHRLRKENPEKTFYPASEVMDCPDMKLATLEKVLWCLEDMQPVVDVSDEVSEKALAPIEKMMEVMGDG